jgi:hypothetical protein
VGLIVLEGEQVDELTDLVLVGPHGPPT